MKNATVADLRNNFATVSRWIYEGESVLIKKRGTVFAVLSPAVKKKKNEIQWPDFEARLNRIFPDGPTKGRSEDVIHDMRGEY